jgi:Tfp pilus assembly protein PilV
MTVVEVLVSMVVITIGLVGLATVLPLSSRGVQTGNELSTATLLAEQRLEQVRAARWTAIPAVDCVGTSGVTAASWAFSGGSAPVTGASCPTAFSDETEAGSSALESTTRLPDPYGRYSRQVRIRPCDAPASECGVFDPALRMVIVRVSSSAVGPAADTTGTPSPAVELTTLVARR